MLGQQSDISVVICFEPRADREVTATAISLRNRGAGFVTFSVTGGHSRTLNGINVDESGREQRRHQTRKSGLMSEGTQPIRLFGIETDQCQVGA